MNFDSMPQYLRTCATWYMNFDIVQNFKSNKSASEWKDLFSHAIETITAQFDLVKFFIALKKHVLPNMSHSSARVLWIKSQGMQLQIA